MAQPDTKELDALLASLNRSAERLQTLWFTFLTITIYFAITALTTTHRMLLLEEPMTLPILQMKIPLLPFFVIAPLFYVVIHFYMLMMMVLLARTTGPFEEELKKTFPIESERERYRMRGENALFLQLLIGAKTERTGFNGMLLAAIALITLAIAPVIVLVLMQMMFLPYHSLEITWWHRAMVIMDFLLVTTLWASYRHNRGVTRLPIFGFFRNDKGDWWKTASLRTVAMVIVAWMTFWEGRWAGEDGPIRYLPRPHEALAGNDRYKATAHGTFGAFPDRLWLVDEIIVGQALLEEKKKEQASRAGSYNFVPTHKFDRRDLQAAMLQGSDLRGVALRSAQMQGADLTQAQMQGANLNLAQMQGADLSRSQMQGADLTQAHMQGADLSGSQMQGANLNLAQMQGANHSGAHMQGANLSRAQMQGADLTQAQMQGANLAEAQMQGANLNLAEMQGAELIRTSAFRVITRYTDLRLSILTRNRADAVKSNGRGDFEPMTAEDVKRWRETATWHVGDVARKKEIDNRFARLAPDGATADEDKADIARWAGWELQPLGPDGDLHRKALATILGDLACAPAGAPHVARALSGRWLVSNRLFTLDQVNLTAIRDRVKKGRDDPKVCLGVVGFTEADWQRLDGIQGR